MLGFNEFLLLLKSLFTIVTTDNNCPYADAGVNNTMCIYSPLACTDGKLIKHGVTDDDIKEILHVHNTYRNKVATGQQKGQPQASDMLELMWDDELSTIAERWAEQCTFEHDQNRNLKNDEYAGQNIAIWYANYDSYDKNFTAAIEAWYIEVVNPGFNPNNIKPYVFAEGYGHYTQVVWGTTGYVGCGYTYFSNVSSIGETIYSNYYVCNYAPGGNVVGGTMYKEGNAASDCPNGPSKNYEGLCGTL